MASERSDPGDDYYDASDTPDVGEVLLPEKVRALVHQREKKGFDLVAAKNELEYRMGVLEKLRPACLKTLQASDFIVMGSDDDALCYLQNTGSQRLKPIVGHIIPEPPTREIIQEDGGQFTVMFSGWLGSKTVIGADYVTGGRSSKERFFDKFDDNENRLPVPLIDVVKAAYSNWENRAISGMVGLRGLTVADLRALGFPVEKCKRVGFKGGGKGGKAAKADAAGNVLCPIGDKKGVPLKDLADGELSSGLAWLEKKAKAAKAAGEGQNVKWAEGWIAEYTKAIEDRKRGVAAPEAKS